VGVAAVPRGRGLGGDDRGGDLAAVPRAGQRLGGRRSLAIAAMCVGMLLFLVLPLWLTIDTLVTHSHDIAALGQRLLDNGLPPPPGWLVSIPVLGKTLSGWWQQVASSGAPQLVAQITPYASDAGKWALAQVGAWVACSYSLS